MVSRSLGPLCPKPADTEHADSPVWLEQECPPGELLIDASKAPLGLPGPTERLTHYGFATPYQAEASNRLVQARGRTGLTGLRGHALAPVIGIGEIRAVV